MAQQAKCFNFITQIQRTDKAKIKQSKKPGKFVFRIQSNYLRKYSI